MVINKTSCCAIQDIDQLSAHGTARGAMIAFCQQALHHPPVFMGPTDKGRKDEISSFYLFTAAVSKRHPTYGQDFYDFIKENELGDVYQSPLRPNRAWHPEHSNQVYVWTPDLKALREWWKDNNPEKR